MKLFDVIDVKLDRLTYCARWGLRSLRPLRADAFQQEISSSEAGIYGTLIF